MILSLSISLSSLISWILPRALSRKYTERKLCPWKYMVKVWVRYILEPEETLPFRMVNNSFYCNHRLINDARIAVNCSLSSSWKLPRIFCPTYVNLECLLPFCIFAIRRPARSKKALIRSSDSWLSLRTSAPDQLRYNIFASISVAVKYPYLTTVESGVNAASEGLYMPWERSPSARIISYRERVVFQKI